MKPLFPSYPRKYTIIHSSATQLQLHRQIPDSNFPIPEPAPIITNLHIGNKTTTPQNSHPIPIRHPPSSVLPPLPKTPPPSQHENENENDESSLPTLQQVPAPHYSFFYFLFFGQFFPRRHSCRWFCYRRAAHHYRVLPLLSYRGCIEDIDVKRVLLRWV